MGTRQETPGIPIRGAEGDPKKKPESESMPFGPIFAKYERFAKVVSRLKPEDVKLYDFRRPDKFSKDQIRTVQIMHETFARLSTSTVSAMLRCQAHAHVECVDQLTYEEFIRSIDNPTCLSVIGMNPLKGSAVMQIDLGLVFAMIDRLFGGTCRDSGLKRDLTDIEESVCQGLIQRVLGVLREAWSTVLDLKPLLLQIETNPMFAQIVPPPEMIILVTLGMTLEGVEGRINLCFPFLTIEPIIGKLSAQYWYSLVRKKPAAATQDVSRLKTEAKVFFEAEKLSLADISRLRRKSLVKLDDFSTAFLAAGGKTVCRLKAKNLKGRYQFDVAREVGSGARSDEAELLKGAAQAQKDDADKIERLLQAPLEKLSGEMKNALETLAGKMSALQKRQEELGDQIFRGAPANGGENALENGGRGKPFSFVNTYDKEAFFNFILNEHPQTIAMILSFLDPPASADLLSRLGEEAQADVAERIGLMSPCAPEVIREVERVLEKKLLWSRKESVYQPDPKTLAGILNVADGRVEKNVVERLEKTNPELAEQVKRSMFLFEHLVLLDDRVIQLLLKKIEPRDLLFALKAVDEKTKNHFLKHLPPEALKKFKEDFEYIGPVRLVDVEAAQQKIIQIVRRMEDDGEIVIARQGDTLVQ